VLHARISAGAVRLPGSPEQSGSNLRLDTTIDPPIGQEATTTVDLTADIGLGQLEVRRATS
jgi:hypothetical protein